MFPARPKSLVGPNDHKLLHAHGCDTDEVARVRGEVFYFRHRRSRAAEKPSKKTGARNPPFFGLRAAPGGQKALPSEALSTGALGLGRPRRVPRKTAPVPAMFEHPGANGKTQHNGLTEGGATSGHILRQSVATPPLINDHNEMSQRSAPPSKNYELIAPNSV
jgi:hypothetical protein